MGRETSSYRRVVSALLESSHWATSPVQFLLLPSIQNSPSSCQFEIFFFSENCPLLQSLFAVWQSMTLGIPAAFWEGGHLCVSSRVYSSQFLIVVKTPIIWFFQDVSSLDLGVCGLWLNHICTSIHFWSTPQKKLTSSHLFNTVLTIWASWRRRKDKYSKEEELFLGIMILTVQTPRKLENALLSLIYTFTKVTGYKEDVLGCYICS